MSCKLELLDEREFYLPGVYLEGKLISSFRKEILGESIEVQLFGKEYVNVKTTHGTLFNLDQQVCFVESVLLKNSPIPSGKHEYNFKIKIPHHIPSTHKGEYGQITYNLGGIINTVRARIKSITIPINIFSPLDLMNYPQYLHKASSVSERKIMMGFCGKNGSITSTIQMEKRVFLCGETMNLTVTINNSSGT
ncbi:hypothetical protein HHI36_017085 [Cryptolaemus montrouzieri]|uniref:Arrestin-like N-terminal domain-containing protein n=1 Tax=Cryptolaemus montrouzieri TaxID=559131 RepID=A0ABD2NLS7_9CUCU